MVRQWLGALAVWIIVGLGCAAVGGLIDQRNVQQEATLRQMVSRLWGGEGRQEPLRVTAEQGRLLPLTAAAITADLDLDPRRKGAFWYATYRVKFTGKYRITRGAAEDRRVSLNFPLPAGEGPLSNVSLTVNGVRVTDYSLGDRVIRKEMILPPGETEVEVTYQGQGLDQWWYDVTAEGNKVGSFLLTVRTNFEGVDFPDGSISPTRKTRVPGGWELVWTYEGLISSARIGIDMPQRKNPVPLLVKLCRAAPIPILLFFCVLLIASAARQSPLHTMHFLLIGAACLVFLLLLVYLVDLLPLGAAFAGAAVMSLALVVSYLMKLAAKRFAILWGGGAQAIYLFGPSACLLFGGQLGLPIVVLFAVTLFIVMQVTAGLDWDRAFARLTGREG